MGNLKRVYCNLIEGPIAPMPRMPDDWVPGKVYDDMAKLEMERLRNAERYTGGAEAVAELLGGTVVSLGPEGPRAVYMTITKPDGRGSNV